MMFSRNIAGVSSTLALGASLLLVFGGTASAAYSFADVDYPGAVWTIANKVNDGGQIVGQYLDGSGVRHGFLLSGGTYTTIDCPSPYTSQSDATGINNVGQIAGRCAAPGGVNGVYGTTVSFVLTGGVQTFLPDVPGSYNGASTFAEDINDSGQVVGWFVDSCLCAAHGFLWSGGTHTAFDAPGFPTTVPYGFNNAGEIVGVVQAIWGGGEALLHGFLLSGGTYTLIDDPDTGSSGGTTPGDINDSGQIVGYYFSFNDSTYHGFSFDGAVFTTVDHPNALRSGAFGINAQGQLAGFYVDLANVLHGWVATPAVSYTATIQPPINVDGTSVFNAKRGVVPVKFTLTANGVPTCQLPPATISVTRTAGGTIGSINESDYIQPSDDGSNFRADTSACQYVYNLGSSSLGVGTYFVEIQISSVTVGSGTFSLK